MARLLDSIFLNLDLTNLTREEVENHLLYLEEIITKNMKVSEQVRFLAYKVQLNWRLVQLDHFKLNQLLFKAGKL